MSVLMVLGGSSTYVLAGGGRGVAICLSLICRLTISILVQEIFCLQSRLGMSSLGLPFLRGSLGRQCTISSGSSMPNFPSCWLNFSRALMTAYDTLQSTAAVIVTLGSSVISAVQRSRQKVQFLSSVGAHVGKNCAPCPEDYYENLQARVFFGLNEFLGVIRLDLGWESEDPPARVPCVSSDELSINFCIKIIAEIALRNNTCGRVSIQPLQCHYLIIMWRVQSRITSSLLKVIKRNLYNPRIYHRKGQYNHDLRRNFYPIVGLRGKRSATIMLNKPNYNNKLSTECVDEMYRFFRSFEVDGSVNHIWVENRGVNCFSDGIEMQDLVNNPDYLRKLFQTAAMISRINKPILGRVKGFVGGAAAYILRSMSSPFAHRNATLALDDIDKGWVPTCGGSYHITRMPGDLGTYLALTGDTINAEEMGQLGFVYGLLRGGLKGWEYQQEASSKSAFVDHDMDHDTYDLEGPMGEQRIATQDGIETFYDNLFLERDQIIRNSEDREGLILDLSKSVLKQQEIETYNAKHPTGTKSEGQSIINYFHFREGRLLQHFKDKAWLVASKSGQFLRFPIQKINEIFHYDTIEEILEHLQKDGSDWAKQTHAKLMSKSPLALKLTLRLIREALNSDYTACMEREYAVANNLLNSQEFRDFLKAGKSSLKLSDITPQRLSSFFNNTEQYPKLEHDLKPYTFYPVKDFKDYLPDSIRFFLNRDFWSDDFRENQSFEVDRWMRNNGIVTHHLTWDLDVLRENIYNKIAIQRRLKARLECIEGILYDSELQREYVDKRRKYMKQFLQDEEKVRNIVKDKIVELFRKRIDERIQDLNVTAECYGLESKAKLLAELRDILTKNRLTEPCYPDPSTDEQKIRHIGLVYFAQDGKGIFDSFNDSFLQTPLRLLKENIERGDIQAPPKTSLQGDKLADIVYPNEQDFNRKFTAENQNYREYLFRYKEEPEHLKLHIDRTEKKLMETIVNQASGQVSELLGKLEETEGEVDPVSELRQALRLSYGDLIDKIKQSMAKEPIKYPDIKVNVDRKIKLSELIDETQQAPQVLPRFESSIEIPEQFKPHFQPLLSEIYVGVCSKFEDWAKTSSLNSLGHLDTWIRSTVNTNFKEFVKNDVEFLFSYFAIKKMEKIVKTVVREEDEQSILKSFEDDFGMKFADFEEADFAVHEFMTTLVDAYGLSKPKILLPSSKLLQKRNRYAANIQTTSHSQVPNLQSFLLTLGQERAKVANRINKPTIFGDDPEYSMEALRMSFKELSEQKPKPDEEEDDDKFPETYGKATEKQEEIKTYYNTYYSAVKRLVEGSTSYYREISKMFQAMLGRDSFLPEELATSAKLAEIPKFFEEFDSRKPVALWFNEKLDHILKTIFDFRLECEKNFTRAELIAFDRELVKVLGSNELYLMLETELKNDLACLNWIKKQVAAHKDKAERENSSNIRAKIKNPDALRKLNNLMMTLKLHEIDNEQDDEDIPEEYQGTVERLVENMFDEPENKQLDEKELQQENFNYRNVRSTEKMPEPESFEKMVGKIQDTNDIGLFYDLKKLCKLKENDKLFQELDKVLKTFE